MTIKLDSLELIFSLTGLFDCSQGETHSFLTSSLSLVTADLRACKRAGPQYSGRDSFFLDFHISNILEVMYSLEVQEALNGKYGYGLMELELNSHGIDTLRFPSSRYAFGIIAVQKTA